MLLVSLKSILMAGLLFAFMCSAAQGADKVKVVKNFEIRAPGRKACAAGPLSSG